MTFRAVQSVAFLLAVATFGLDAHGQSSVDQASRASGASATGVVTVASVLGRVFTTAAGEKGRIIDVLADESGQVRASVVELGGFLGVGTRKVAVEWSAIRFVPQGDGRAVHIEVEPDKLRAAPEYKPNLPTVLVQPK